MKKILSKLLSIVMAAAMLVTAMPTAAFASTVYSPTVQVNGEQAQQPQNSAPEVTEKVTIHFVDGSTHTDVEINKGGSYDIKDWPSPATPAGYRFTGWSDGSSVVASLDNVQQDITLTAQYVQLFTIFFENWDGTPLSSVTGQAAGTSFTSAGIYNGPNPTRDGYGFTGWQPATVDLLESDMTIEATFAQLTQCDIVINYVYENQQQAAPPYVATVSSGYQLTQTIPSPSILGYTPDQANVTFDQVVSGDIDVQVTYHPNGNTTYYIKYYQQNVAGTGYDLVNTVERTGVTGSQTAVVAADAIAYPGFSLITDIATSNQIIAADGNTTIQLKYNRDIHYVLFDTADGTYIEPQVGRFGATVTTPANPSRAGYSFNGWNPNVPATIGATDVTITAKWTAQQVGYTIVVWRENPNDTNYSYAGTVTTQKALAGSTLNSYNTSLYTDSYSGYFTYNHCDTVTVKGDGSSVQNVFFSRNTYTASFKLAVNDTYLVADGVTYNHKKNKADNVDYSFTAKYDSDISNLWPSYVGPDSKNFNGWTSPSISNIATSKRLTFTTDLLGATFTASYNGSVKDTLIYMLETPDGSGTSYYYNGTTRYYSASEALGQVVYSDGGNWGSKAISGFTAQNVVTVNTAYSGWMWNQTVSERTITLYYTRNKASITFHNGDSVTTQSGIFFEASITSYNYTPTRPTGVDSDYVFTGWYTNENLNVNALFNWTNAKMPANGLILYSGWKKPTYAVTFDLNYTGGGVYGTQTVEKNATATSVTAPTRDGFQFDYWYYLDGSTEKLFTFSMPITHAYNLLAHWTAVAVNYTVRYKDASGNAVKDASGNVIADKTGSGKVGQSITENAVAAYNGSGQALFPDRMSASLTLQAAAGSNIITFTYNRQDTVYYIVRYVDGSGNQLAANDGPTGTANAVVTVQYKNVPGYSPTLYQQTLSLAAETDPNNIQHNIITFVYTPNPTGTYLVKYYQQNVNDNQYTLLDSETETFTNAPLGSTVTATIKTFAGFTFVNGISTTSGVVYSSENNPLVLCVYYNRAYVAYSASYLDSADNASLAPDTTGTARFGKTVTLQAKSVTGYTLDTSRSTATQTITIGMDPAANHVNFYYLLRTDVAVTIRFLSKPDNTPIAPEIILTSADDRTIRVGNSYSYTLPGSKDTIDSGNETFHHDTTQADTLSLTVVDGSNYLTYLYIPETYHITYDANGGTGAPTDTTAYRAGAQVALSASAPSYGVNRFEGWSESSAVIGRVYESQNELNAVNKVTSPYAMPRHNVTLYAVWSHLSILLTYACEAPHTGNVPSPADVPINTPYTVAGVNTLSRTGYVFSGWKLKNGAGELVDPAYGPGWTSQITLSAPTTLYATWTPVDYTISYVFDLPGTAASRVTNPNTQTVYNVESAALTLAAASLSGYTFEGWYLDENYDTAAAVPAIPTGSTGNQTFYGKFSVNKDGLTVDGYTGVYDGNSHGVSLSDTYHYLLPSDEVVYSTPNSYTNITGGPISVTVTVSRDGEVIFTGAATVTITPRPITLTAEGIDTIYNGEAHTIGVTVPTGAAGAVNDAEALAIRNAVTYAVAGSPVENSFTDAMAATVVTVSAVYPNYTITSATPTVKIAPRVVTITAGSLNEVYDGTEKSVLNWIVSDPTDTTGLVGTDAIDNVTLMNNKRTVVGTDYPEPSGATLSAGDAANYSFDYQNGTLTITQSDALTLSVTADTYIYDGNAHTYQIDTAGVPVTLEYKVGSGDWQTVTALNPLPSYTNVGEYPITVQASNPNYSNVPQSSATLEITKRDVTVRAGTLSRAYTGATFSMTDWSVDTATENSGLVAPDAIMLVKLTNNTRRLPGQNDVGIAVLGWSSAANPDNYNVITEPGSIEVTQNTGAPGISTEDVTVTYDGSQHGLAYYVNIPDDTPYSLRYRINGGTWKSLAINSALPAELVAGTYVFDLMITSEYYAQDGTTSGTLTINRRPVMMTADSSLGNIYNGDPVSVLYLPEAPGTNRGMVAGDEVYVTLTGTPQTEAGTYAVSFDRTKTAIRHSGQNVTDSYDISYTDGTIEILKAGSQAAPTDVSHEYDNTAYGFVSPILKSAGGTALSDVDVAWSLTDLAPEAAGWNTTALPEYTEVNALDGSGNALPYTIYVRLSHANYQTQVVPATLTITPAPVTLTADTNDTFPYTLLAGGTAKEWSIDTAHWQLGSLAQDTLYAGDTITYALANNTQSEVGDGHDVTFASYSITDAAHAKNYVITPVNGHIRVVQGTDAATLAAQDLTFTYDATAHSLVQPTVSVATVGGSPVDRTAAYTFSYKVTSASGTQTLSTLPNFTDAGTYTVKITATSTQYAKPDDVTVTVTVNKRPLVLTSETNSFPYDAQPHTVAVLSDANGYAPATDHAVDALQLVLMSGQTNTATLAGTYPVQIDPASAKVMSGTTDVTANYAVSTVAGSLLIQPRRVTATEIGLADVEVPYDSLTHSVVMPTSLAIGTQTIDLTDTTRFTFAYQELDLLTAGALETDSDTNPEYVNVSKHRVTVQITDATGSLLFDAASATVTVNKLDVTITPNSDTFLYDGNEHVVTGAISVGFLGSDGVAVTLQGNHRTAAGNNEITWLDPISLDVGDINNYNLIHDTGTITVNPADDLAVTLTNHDATYDALPHGFTYTLSEPIPAAAKLEYSTDGVNWIEFASESDLPTFTDAGIYPLQIRATSPNYSNTATADATLTIAQRLVTIAPTDKSLEYDGLPHAVDAYTTEKAATGTDGALTGNTGLIGTDDVTVTLTGTPQTEAGQYPFGCENAQAVTGTTLGNYTFDYQIGTLSIWQLSGLSIDLSAYDGLYDGDLHGFSFNTNAIGAYTLEYSTDGINWTTFTTADELPSSYDVVVRPLAVRVTSANYVEGSAADMAILRIAKRPLTIAITTEAFLYDGAPHSLTASAQGLISTDTLDSYQLDPASETEMGEYLVSLVNGQTVIKNTTRAGNQYSNYDVTLGNGMLLIVDFTLTGYTGTYDGQPHSVTPDVPGILTDLYDVTYTYNGQTTADNPQFTNAGTYPVTVTITPKNPNAGLPALAKNATVEIGKKQIALQVSEINKTYDAVASSLIVSLPVGAAATAADEAAILGGVEFRWNNQVIANSFTNAGTTNVTVSASNDNYEIASAQTTVRIAKRPITLTADTIDVFYDEQPHTAGYTYTVAQYDGAGALTNNSGLLNLHTLTANLNDNVRTNVCNEAPVTFAEGLTTILQGATSVLNNYDITYVKGSITIRRARVLTLSLQDYVGIYDAQAHGVTLQSVKEGQRNIDLNRFTWYYGTAADTVNQTSLMFTNVVDQLVYVKGVSIDGNYPDVTGTARVTITARPVTITPSNATFTYDGTEKTATEYTTEKATTDNAGNLTGTRGLIGTDDVTVTLTNATHTAPGHYALGWSNPVMTTGLATNYSFVPGDGTMTINPAESGLTISIADDTLTYDALAHRLTYQVIAPSGTPYVVEYSTDSGATYTAVGTDGLLPEHTNAGAYPIRVRVTSDYFVEGYENTADATLTIEQRALTITSETDDTFVYDGAEHSVDGLWQVQGLVDDSVNDIHHQITGYSFVSGKANTQTTIGAHGVLVDDTSVVVKDGINADVTANYDIGVNEGHITVGAQNTSMAPTDRTVTYNAEAQNFTLPTLLDAAGLPVTEPVTYEYSLDGITWQSTPITYTNVQADAYQIEIRASSANYVSQKAAATLTIQSAPVTLTAGTNVDFVYTVDGNGDPIEWSVTDASVTDGTLYGGALFSYTLVNNTQSEVGEHALQIATYAIKIGDVDVTANYNVTTEEGRIGVKQGTADATMIAVPSYGIYKAQDYTLTKPTISVKSSTGAYVDQTAKYSFQYDVTLRGTTQTWTFTNELPHFTDVGVYDVAITATSTRLKSPVTGATTMTIVQRPIIVTSGDNRATPYTYNGAEQTVQPFMVSMGTLMGSDAITAYTFAADKSNANTDVVDRDVLLSTVTLTSGTKDVTANYAITLRPGHIVIRALTVNDGLTLTGDNHVYDGGTHSATLNDTLVTSIGNFSLSDTKLGDGSNRFVVEYTSRPNYGAESSRSATSPAFTDVTTQTIKAYVTDRTGNLIITPDTANVVITRRSVTLVADSDTVTYDGLGHSITTHSHPKAEMSGGVALGTTGFVGTDDANTNLWHNGPFFAPDTYTVYAGLPTTMISGKASNYSFHYGNGTLTILKATGIDLMLSADNSVYDGLSHGYTATPVVPTGTPVKLEYRIGASGWRTVSLTNPLPSYVNQGAYPITVRLSSPYYTDTVEKTVTLTITRRPITITSGNNSLMPYVYNRTMQYVIPGYISEGTLGAFDWLDLGSFAFAQGKSNGNIDACDRDVLLTSVRIGRMVTDTATNNYAITFNPGRIVILKAASTAVAATRTETYAGTPYAFNAPTLRTSGGQTLSGVSYAYSLTQLAPDSDGWTPITNFPTREDVLRGTSGEVSSYVIYVRITHPNYETRVTTSTLTINPAAISVTADTKDDFVYTLDGAGQPVVWSIHTAQLTDGSLYRNATLEYTLANNTQAVLGGHNVDVDTCRVVLGATDYTPNYTITKLPGHIQVIKGTEPSLITAQGDTVTYDGQTHGIPQPVISVMNSEGDYLDRTGEFDITYNVALAGTAQTWTYTSASDIAFTDVGEYDITISAVSSLHATPANVTVKLIINRRNLTITSEDNSAAPYTYNGLPQSVQGDASVVNLVSGQTLDSLTYVPGKENVNTDAVDREVLLSGVRVLSGSADVTANYNIQYNPGRLVINPYEIPAENFSLTDVVKEYDGNAYSLDIPATIETGLPGVAPINIATEFTTSYLNQDTGVTGDTNPSFIDVGDHGVTVSLSGSASGNYKDLSATAAVKITPRSLTISYGTLTVTYDGTPHTVDRTVDGLIARDAIDITDLNRVSTDATRTGDRAFEPLIVTAESWNITDANDLTIDRNANYTVSVITGSLNVRPIALIVAVTSETHTYSATTHTVTGFTVTGTPLNGHEVAAVLNNNSARHVVRNQPVGISTVNVTDTATSEDMTRNYSITETPGTLTINPAPLSLLATTLTVLYDGQGHQPAAYVGSGLQAGDSLTDYGFVNMPQSAAGRYATVRFNPDLVTLTDADGYDVTSDYTITYGTGSLTIYLATTTYTVQYYYDGVLDPTQTITRAGTQNDTITTYTPRQRDGYELDHTENFPLTLSANGNQNIIRVFYRTAANLIDITDLGIPLAGAGFGSLENGFTIE